MFLGGTVDENLATLWEALGQSLALEDALVFGERRITWQEFEDRAARLAGALADRGVKQGHKVALYLWNCPEYLEAVFAAFKLGAVPVNVNYRYLGDELAYLLNDAGAAVLVFHASLSDRVAEVRDRVPAVGLLVSVDDAPQSPGIDALQYHDLVEHARLPARQGSGSDQLILYTGGTTGMPKGVVWAHHDLFVTLGYPIYTAAGFDVPTTLAEVADTARRSRDRGGSPVTLSGPPLMHGTSLFLSMSTFLLGGRVVLLEARRLDPHAMLRLIETERVTQLVIVGDAFARPLTEAMEQAEQQGRPYDLSSLQRITSSGMIWSARYKRSFLERCNATLLDMLGASEGGPFGVAISAPGDDPETATFKVADRCVVFDEDMKPLAPGSPQAGLLGVSGVGPLGYHGDQEKSDATFRVIDGVRYAIPGDYGRVDADGTLHLLGRGSVSINTGGEKVYPEEVEEGAKLHPAVADCNVVGIPDDRLGEAVTLVVAVRDGLSVAPDEIRAHLGGRLASFKVPRHVVVVEEIQRSGSGKADYRWARRVAIEHVQGVDGLPELVDRQP
jgi:fatty-acyl-CoA synthase